MRFWFLKNLSRNSAQWIGVFPTLILFVILQGNDSLLKGQTNAIPPNTIAPPNPPGTAANTAQNPPPGPTAQATGRTTQTQPLIPDSIINTGRPGGSTQIRSPNQQPTQPQPERPQEVLPNSGQPFPQLTRQEAADLDRFLERWEKGSSQIGYFETEFQCWEKGEDIFDPIQAEVSTYGTIRYIAPNKGYFEVVGLVINGKAEQAPPERRTKFLSTGDKIYHYDFAEKHVTIYSIPFDQRDGIAGGGPMPFVFGAKADDLKKRYYLRIITPPQNVEKGELWLEAFPRTQEDAAEFKSVQLIFHERKLIPLGFLKFDVNEKKLSSYKFLPKTMKIDTKSSPSLVQRLASVGKIFERPSADIPNGWTKEEIDPMQAAPQVSPQVIPAGSRSPQPAPTQPRNPQSQQPAVQEDILYTPQTTPQTTPQPGGKNRPQF